ncbi:MAG: GspE/PulE family protein, partial [Candidatus Shapirobacteria bacterium]|nr:GspE/PulE family protein [Candidatus Shapirobacteria bacterium]
DIAESQSRNLGDLLYEMDLVTDEQIGQTVADIYSLPNIKLEDQEINDDSLNTISEIFSKKQNIIAFKKDKQGLSLATSNPSNKTSLDFITKKTGLPLKIYFATERSIKKFWENREAKLGTSFEAEIEKLILDSENINSLDTPIISLASLILEYSEKNHASDIHIEPGEDHSTIRFRIDSILHDVAIIPLKIHLQLISRIKVMSKLKIDEQQSAQDGKFQFKIGNDKIDVRVSITPVINGEKAVLRLLSSASRQFSLSTLGLNEADLNKIIEAHKKPFGMILSTGPTGSGKTTTLYAVLKLINTREVNIMTIEDPVEYEVGGINQIQVNPLTNLTFAEGLRSIVRQDPNIILVGEIRDQETAQIALQAALTGHLVLSTLHTNDAATTIPRLMEMGIEPFIIASSVNCIIAQRLVRQICQKCRTSKEVSKEEISKFNLDAKTITELFGDKNILRVYYGKGCNVCHQTGYLGRIGIFEVMVLDQDLREAIISKQSSEIINNLAIKSGMQTMLSDGIKKVLSGVTTIEEIIRATKI